MDYGFAWYLAHECCLGTKSEMVRFIYLYTCLEYIVPVCINVFTCHIVVSRILRMSDLFARLVTVQYQRWLAFSFNGHAFLT